VCFVASFKLSFVQLLLVDRVYCCSCLVCVAILCVFVVLCGHFFFLLKMPDCWLEVSIRKVLRPAISTQVFLGFPVPKRKC